MLFFFEIGFLVLAVAAVVAGEVVGPRTVLGPALVLVVLSWVAWEVLGRRPYAQAMRAVYEAAPRRHAHSPEDVVNGPAPVAVGAGAARHRTPLPEDVVNGWLHVNKMCVLGIAGLAVWALVGG
jgi:hypothetical protein